MKKLIYFILLLPFLSFGQNFLKEKTQEYFDIVSPEKVYIHTNKTLFQPGEIIYFKAYIIDAMQKAVKNSSLLNIEILSPDGSKIDAQISRISKGTAEGSYLIPQDVVGGIYKIRGFTQWQRNQEGNYYEKEITVQRILAPRLLMKLDIKKEAYGPGELVTAKVSVRNLQDISIKNLEFEYVATIDKKELIKEKATTDENGEFTIQFNLPEELSGNDGSLNVKFLYENNIESISRSIPIILNNLDLQFMPEGGYALDGDLHKIAFKALNKFGKPAEVKGEILDQQGNRITTFESFHQGMGSFELSMEKGKEYFAKITSPFKSSKLISLPKTESRPASLSLERINEKQIKAIIFSSENQKIQLVGRTFSELIFQKEFSLKKGKNEEIIDAKDLPMGILQFTLFQNNIPLAERLIFNHQDKGLKIQISTDKDTYNTREKVNAAITTTTADGNPISANLSVSVVNDKLISYHDDKQHNINTWLLAGSELKGEIYEPKFYFDLKEEKRYEALDLLLLTQGWRFFNWEKIISDETIKLQYQAEKSNKITGTVKDLEKNKGYQTNIYVLVNEILYAEKTDKNGNFQFNLPEPSLNSVFVFAEREVGKRINIEFGEINKPKPTEFQRKSNDSYQKISDGYESKEDIPILSEIKKAQQELSDDEFWNESGNIELSAVTLLGASIQKSTMSSYVVVRSEDISSISTSVADALSGKIAGLHVQSGNNSQVIIRGVGSLTGQNKPLLVVDGVIISGDGINLAQISPNQINSVQVLRGMEATSLYGSRGASGVIIISTNGRYNYYDEKLTFNLGKNSELFAQAYNNYQSSNLKLSEIREFYMPKYTSLITENKDDFRNCIYWNYNLTTDENGKGTFHFYNSDESTVFRIIAEGFDGKGLIGRAEKTYSTFDAVEMDVKFPLYATEGDQIQMPVWFKNNTAKNISANLTQDLPHSLKLLKDKSNLELNPGETQTQYVPILVENGKKGTYKFRVNLLSNNFKQSVTKDLKIFERGFPQSVGKTTLDHTFFEFISKNEIEGSQSAIFTIYLNPLDPIIKGIERIIREPHGCFEQVSSSTYPNIYALSLLKLNENKDNESVRANALKYLNSGYKKLAAYEISGGGFDWYGRPSAHETLSAFGLVEFTEMKPFLNVDEKMIQRTKNWLISRKDGKGGYKLVSGRYAFSGSKDDVAYAYINYALSFAGEKNIESEYEKSKNEAIKSKDLYRLALNALTAHQLNKTNDFTKIMTLLKSEISKSGYKNLTADGSITYSGNQSLRVEILSFYALALMKEKNLSSEINQVLKEIVESGSGGYFGSTQATGLALKTIYEYSKLYTDGQKMNNDKVFLNINGNIVLDATMSEFYQKGKEQKKNSIEIDVTPYIISGNNQIEMKISSDKMSFADLIYKYRSSLPDNSKESQVRLNTSLSKSNIKVGETTQMQIEVKNLSSKEIPMTVAKIGIPGGLSVEPALLKELIDKEKAAYYEIMDNFLVLYWRKLNPNESKIVDLVFKAEVPGVFTGVASSAYLYYTEEFKHWNEGLKVHILP